MGKRIYTIHSPRARAYKGDPFKDFAHSSKLKVTPLDRYSIKAFVEAPNKKELQSKVRQFRKKKRHGVKNYYFDMKVL